MNPELQTRIENQEIQGDGLVYNKIMSQQRENYKTNPRIGRTYRELLFNNPAILNFKNIDKLCELWSVLAKMFLASTNQNSTPRIEQHFNQLDEKVLDFSNELKTVGIPKSESQNILSPLVFELNVKLKEISSVTLNLLPI